MEKDRVIFNSIGYLFILIISALCALPFILIVSASFSSSESIFRYGYRFIPKEFSLEAYQVLFAGSKEILRAYGVSLTITLGGAFLGLFITAMTAYVLYRKDFRFRNHLAFFFFFTLLFSGGLIPGYILVVKYLHLKDTLGALILPTLLSAWFIILMRNFMASIPDAISESAKVDGAGDFTIFIRLILPLSGPGLATIGLFIALGYWNDWFNALLYIENSNLYPLQYFLYNMLSKQRFMEMIASSANVSTPDLPMESLKMAMAVVATGPIVLAYPFVQKYFVKGITLGSVKG